VPTLRTVDAVARLLNQRLIDGTAAPAPSAPSAPVAAAAPAAAAPAAS
jgi:hypothetical protein